MADMADNGAIIAEIEKASYWEEDFIVKYDTDNIWVLLKSLPKEKFERISKLFKQNIADTERHSKIMKKMVKDIRSGKLEL